MMSLPDNKQAADAFNTTSRYLGDILNINVIYFDNMVSKIYPAELQHIKANTSDTLTSFLNFIRSFQMLLFLPNFMINGTILIMKLPIFYF